MDTVRYPALQSPFLARALYPIERRASRRRLVACIQVLDLLMFLWVGSEWNGALASSSVHGHWVWQISLSLLLAASAHCVFERSGLYDFDVLTRARDAGLRTLFAGLIVFGPLVISLMLLDPASKGATAIVSGQIGLAVLGTAALRVLLAQLARALRDSGIVRRRILIISETEEAGASLGETLRQSPNNKIMGVWSLSSEDTPAEMALQEALEFARLNPIDVIILKMSISPSDRLMEVAQVLRALPRLVLFAPILGTPETQALRVDKPWAHKLDQTGNTIFIKLSDRPLAGWYWVAKDIQDRIIALLLLVVALPTMLIIALGIKLSDPGPVFFRQKRFGYRGDTFDIIKFRTMRVAQESGAALKLTARDDPRVFPFGRFLRKTSMDELPQLLNVVLGDMWIVGPRPHSPFATAAGQIYAKAVEGYAARYRIKPGITGWAQVCGWRGPTETLEQLRNRVQHDLFYIENWSPGFDFKILYKTLFIAFGHDNAF